MSSARILLAPMEGLLDADLRDVITSVGGIDVCVTPFIRVTGSILPTKVYSQAAPELANSSRTRSGVPVRVQLLGSDPTFLALNANRLAKLHPAAIDLNFGCPAKTVNRHRGGAVLLREPELLETLVKSVRAAVPKDILVTAKMRLGFADKTRALDCALALEAGGAGELVVHARTKLEGYKPPAHWEWLGRIRDVVRVPVIANGEIWSLDAYKRCIAECGSGDIMLGRGMIADPGLALRVRSGGAALFGWRDVSRLLWRFWQRISERNAPLPNCGRIKQWLRYLARSYPEAMLAFAELRTVTEPAVVERYLAQQCGAHAAGFMDCLEGG